MNHIDISNLSAPKKRYLQQLDNPNWKLKASNIRKRDNYECQLCGTQGKSKVLEVHHLRYIDGKDPWDYDDGDLVTLCHRCHEKLHAFNYLTTLERYDYFYHTGLEGVGIVEHAQHDGLWFNVCWTETEKENGHGRLYIQAVAYTEYLRKPTEKEIADFWINVDKYYDIEYIIEVLGPYIHMLLPYNHFLRIKARNRYKEALSLFASQAAEFKKRFDYFLLESDTAFAEFTNIRIESNYEWNVTENVLPHAYFHVYPKADVLCKSRHPNDRMIKYEDFDFTGYHASNADGVFILTEYQNMF